MSNNTNSRLQRKIALDYSTFLQRVGLELYTASALQNNKSKEAIANVHGLTVKGLEMYEETLANTLNDTLQQQSLRLGDFFTINTDLFTSRVKALAAGSINKYEVNTIGAYTQMAFSIICHVKKWLAEGNMQLLLSVGFDYQQLELLSSTSLPEALVIAETINIEKEALIRFNSKFVDLVIKPSHESTKKMGLVQDIVSQGITQKHAESYLGMKKTALGEVRDYLNCKGRTTGANKPRSNIDRAAKAQLLRIYERDYGLYSRPERVKLMYDIAKEFNVTFSCVADSIEEKEEFYSWLRENNATFDFAQSFYNVPSRLQELFTSSRDRCLDSIIDSGVTITVHHVLSQQTANERLRLHLLTERTGLALSELHKLSISKCSSKKEQDNVNTVFKNAATALIMKSSREAK
ncbi:hypothetical protein [Vibrio sp. R78045]|uniref:hypothetical protein n=1 Tax=Vibrio sp. R78045 TaxID=3093868 RepID=UPI0036F32697